MNELALLDWLRRQPGVAGVGDDCAVLNVPRGEELLVTTDQLVEGVHFRRETHTAFDCGWKALARGLSDMAAMGGRPRWAFTSVAAGDARWWQGFQRGLLRLATRLGVTLAGGDLTHASKTYVDVIVLGTAPRGAAIRRSGARAGDRIYVSGPLGRAAARGWRGRPEPRVSLGLKLRGRATACIDISDGLALDLHRLCKESCVGAEIDAPPIARGATLEQALHGGEDYELLCTLPPGKRIAGLIPVGCIVAGPAGRVRFRGRTLPPRGWDPFVHWDSQ